MELSKKNKIKTIVSIIMSTYNDEKYLDRSIKSVLNQTYKNWEFIIINDASTDKTLEILKRYSKLNPHITLISNKVNYGQSKSANHGIRISKGKYIARLDGDDVWSDRNKLKIQVDFLDNNPDYGLVGCFGFAVDATDTKLFDIQYPSSNEEIKKILLRHCCFIHSSILVRKQNLLKVGLYKIDYHSAQDYELYLNLGIITKFYNVPKYMVNYRINNLGISRTKYKSQIADTIRSVRKYHNYYDGYFTGLFLWSLRKYYPIALRTALTRKIKKSIPLIVKLSGA